MDISGVNMNLEIRNVNTVIEIEKSMRCKSEIIESRIKIAYLVFYILKTTE